MTTATDTKALISAVIEQGKLLVSDTISGKETLKGLKATVKASQDKHMSHTNIALADLYRAGWKWTGNSKTNAVAKGLTEAFTSLGLAESTVLGYVANVKWCYEQKFMMLTLDPKAQKKRATQKDLLTGEDRTILVDDVSCAKALITGTKQAEFEKVSGIVWAKIMQALDIQGVEIAEPGEALQSVICGALIEAGLAVQDGDEVKAL